MAAREQAARASVLAGDGTAREQAARAFVLASDGQSGEGQAAGPATAATGALETAATAAAGRAAAAATAPAATGAFETAATAAAGRAAAAATAATGTFETAAIAAAGRGAAAADAATEAFETRQKRAKLAEELAVPSTTVHPKFDSRLALDLVKRWCWGELSAVQVQQLALKAYTDAKSLLGSLGKSPDHIQKSLTSLAFKAEDSVEALSSGGASQAAAATVTSPPDGEQRMTPCECRTAWRHTGRPCETLVPWEDGPAWRRVCISCWLPREQGCVCECPRCTGAYRELASREDAFEKVWEALLEEYRSQRTPVQFTSMAPSSFIPSTGREGKYPKLKGRGAEVKGLALPLLAVWSKFKRDTVHDRKVGKALSLLCEMQEILDEWKGDAFMSTEASERFMKTTEDFLQEYSYLGDQADRDGRCLFSCVPKLHWLWHMADRAKFLNPRRCCNDEERR